MRILLPSIVDPWLHRGGAGAATRGLLSLLREPPLTAEVDVVVPSSPLPHVLRQLVALMRSSMSASPSKALFHDTPQFRRSIARTVATGRHDLVLINGSDLLWMLPHLPAAVPRVLYSHNLERDLFASQLEGLPAPLRWALGRLQQDLAKLERYELDGMRAVGRVLFISAADEARVRREAADLTTLHVPPLFDYEAPARRPGCRPDGTPQLGFLANFTWWPNRDALRWLLREVLPSVRRDLRLHLFGEGSTHFEIRDPRVVAHGFVDDVAAVFARCSVMLCPLVSGAGVSIKFAEAVYNRVPVLATPFAARGLRVAAGQAVVLAEGVEEWVRVLDGEGLDTLAAQEIHAKTARTFAPAAHVERVHEFLRAAVAGANGPSPTTPELRCAPSR